MHVRFIGALKHKWLKVENACCRLLRNQRCCVECWMLLLNGWNLDYLFSCYKLWFTTSRAIQCVNYEPYLMKWRPEPNWTDVLQGFAWHLLKSWTINCIMNEIAKLNLWVVIVGTFYNFCFILNRKSKSKSTNPNLIFFWWNDDEWINLYCWH